jgi:hypothetical protein
LGCIYSSNLWPWRRRQHVFVNHWYPFMVSHSWNITLKLWKSIFALVGSTSNATFSGQIVMEFATVRGY